MLVSHTSSIGELIVVCLRDYGHRSNLSTPTSATPLSTQFGSSEIISLESLS